MFNLISDQTIGKYAQKILTNLLSSEEPSFAKPFWLPSKKEIKDLLKQDHKILIEVTFQIGNQSSKSFTLPHFSKVEHLMEQIYNLSQISSFLDKYAFWLYLTVEESKASEDKALPQEGL